MYWRVQSLIPELYSVSPVSIIPSALNLMSSHVDALSVYDARDPTSTPQDLRESAHEASASRLSKLDSNTSLAGLRIGIPQVGFSFRLLFLHSNTLRNISQRNSPKLSSSPSVPFSHPSNLAAPNFSPSRSETHPTHSVHTTSLRAQRQVVICQGMME